MFKRNSVSSTSSGSDDDYHIPVPLHKFSPAKLYNELTPLKLTPVDLRINGYPFLDVNNKHQAVFETNHNNKHDWVPGNETLRRCSRCQESFDINDTQSQKCVFHHRPQWDAATDSRRLACCSDEPGSSKGCMEADRHVFSSALEDTLWEFVATPKATGPSDGRSKKVYALDCELVYTLNGLEVARVSLVDMKGRVLFDTFVLPAYEIVDYNTAFSGVTEKDLQTAISFEACRLQLFQHINSSTLLVGHSLECDLKALRLVHHNVIDTAVLFAVRIPTTRRVTKLALRTLAWKLLGRHIQTDSHCSAQDAIVCMELLAHRHLQFSE